MKCLVLGENNFIKCHMIKAIYERKFKVQSFEIKLQEILK